MTDQAAPGTADRLEKQSHDDLLQTTRRLLADVQALSTRIAAAQEIAIAINRSLDLDEILQIVGREAKWLLDFNHCSVCLCQKDGPDRFVTLFGPAVGREALVVNDSDPLAIAIRTRQPQLIQPAGKASTEKTSAYTAQLIIPLESEDEVLGTINFAQGGPRPYNQEDLRVSYFLALQLAGAIRNAKRFREVNEVYAQLEQAYGDLRQAEKLRDDLTHMVVHDLRNPLTVMLGSLELIGHFLNQGQKRDSKLSDLIVRSRHAGRRMMGLIEDMLRVSQFESGELRVSLAAVSLQELLAERVQDYLFQAEKEGKSFAFQCPADLPAVTADAHLVERVVDNLVENAFKFTEQGGRIELRVEAKEAAFYVTVSDDGQGIPPEQQERIFQKFAQVTDTEGRPLRGGTGLGLTFCQIVVEAHNGRIWAESTPGRGSAFTFTLPVVGLV
ncbi:MAG: ATP-binding protein [Chloroflexi bacterium]|nr:ATP-binding protein [Chloroflexota bacterium]